MRLDFNETNILVQAISDLDKQKNSVITKDSLLDFLSVLHDNTSENYSFIRQSIKTLISKLENLSDKNIRQIQNDKRNNKIIASTCYVLPQL